MKFYLAVTAFIFFHAQSTAQQRVAKHYFKEVGWAITLPGNFTVLDSAQNNEKNEKGKAVIKESTEIEIDASKTITLIAATKDQYNYFNATITPFDTSKDGDWNEANQAVEKLIYSTFADKMTDARIDSSSSIEMIDGLPFNDFKVSVTVGNKTLFTSHMISRLYKGYDFGITYLYLDDETKNEIEGMIRNSKFDK